LTALVGDDQNVIYANSKGSSAWRGDCWGNGTEPDGSWNHHINVYWPMARLMFDGWKTGTVALEPCGTMGGYPTAPKDVADDAISWHATFIQNKSHPIPASWLPDIERIMMQIGFRLFLRSVTFDDIVSVGSAVPVALKWKNKGIAPPYRDHRIAFRLIDKNGDKNAATISEKSIRGWLPGDIGFSMSYKLPADLKAGDYELEMGIVFHSSIEHTIPIANKGKTSDGWYKLGNLKVIE